MNIKGTISKLSSFCFNLTVAALAVSIFDQVWYGYVIAIFCFILANILSLFNKGE